MEDNAYNCWNCRHLRLDLAKGYICQKSGRKLADRQNRFYINTGTDCKDWEGNL